MPLDKIFHLPCTDPKFHFEVFFHLLELQKEHPLVQLFDIQNEARLSMLFDFSGVQESFRFRALNRARRISLALVDEKAEIKRDLLKNIIALLEKEGHFFYPGGTNDILIHEHILNFLKILDSEETLKSIKRFQKPLVHKWAEKVIFETLGVHATANPTDAQIRAAVLCACLTPLRQNVGSCFATAPAILIQRDQIPLFLDDLYQLLFTGKLKRTFGGVEYILPLSPSTGIAELKKNLISPNSKPGFCPGLIAALEVAGAISETPLTLEEKGEAVQSLIQKWGSGKNQLTSESLIRSLLLQKFHLSQEEVEQGRSLEMAQFKSAKMARGFSSSQKLEQITAFLQKEKECTAAFKGVCDNALLKVWEFTLASFSEVKMEFSRWNLYSSLGFAPEEVGGIGELIYQRIDEKINDLNKDLEKAQEEYQIAFDQLRSAETLLRNATSESEARRLQAEYQSRSYHMRVCLEMRDEIYNRGSQLSNLFSFLTKQYDEKFPEYFQEIYDAQMQDFQGEIYDDSPAGFRLVYKHGRADPSVWTLIYDADQYIESLLDFFSSVEPQIASACDWEGGEQNVLELSSAIISHIRSELFLETALQRMAKAHQIPVAKSPLANLKMLEKKPWAYTSGGTMTTLLKTYYCHQKELTHEEKWVENESELLIFILDTLKNLPPKITDPYLKSAKGGMLISSPTHAFILLPGLEGLKRGWQEDIFTYTWVRDEIFLPSQHFYAQMELKINEQAFLLEKFCEQLSPAISMYLHQGFLTKEHPLTIIQWRNQLLQGLIQHAKAQTAAQKQQISDSLDAFLYKNLPVVQGGNWKRIVRRILSDRMSGAVEEVLDRLSDLPAPLLTAHEIRQVAASCYLLAEKSLCLPFDLHHFVAKHTRFIGLAPPTPLLFADTNWTGYSFGFVVNPGNGHLELWRLDATLSQGVQMSQWKQYLNGSVRKTWSIFTRPNEYGGG